MQVHGIDDAPWRSRLRSRSLTSFHELSLQGSDSQRQAELLSHLRDIHPQVFLPLDSEMARWSVNLLEELPAGCQTLLPPAASYQAAYDKDLCLQECRRLSIPVPLSFTREEALHWFQNGGGRLVIKPRIDLGAARGMNFAESADELDSALAQCSQTCRDVTIQEYIPGESDSYCNLTVLFDKHTRLIAASTFRKHLSYPLTGGLNAIGVSTYQPELLEQMLPLFRHWRWAGVAEVEFRIDKRDGLAKVFEINPRVPGYCMFQVFSGVDYPRLALTAALDQVQLPELEQLSSYRVGLKNINPTRAFAAARSLVASQGLFRTLAMMRRLTRGGLPFLAHQLFHLDEIWQRYGNRT